MKQICKKKKNSSKAPNITSRKYLIKKKLKQTHLNGKGIRDYHDDHRYVECDKRAENEKSSIINHANPGIRHNVLGIRKTCI